MMAALAWATVLAVTPVASTTTQECRRDAQQLERMDGGVSDRRLSIARTRCWSQPEIGSREMDQIRRERQLDSMHPGPAPELTPRADEWRGRDPLSFD